MFKYTSEPEQVGRTWRPDLVPLIRRYLENLDPVKLSLVSRLAVGICGEAVIYFDDPQTGQKDIVIFDHDQTMLSADGEILTFRGPPALSDPAYKKKEIT